LGGTLKKHLTGRTPLPHHQKEKSKKEKKKKKDQKKPELHKKKCGWGTHNPNFNPATGPRVCVSRNPKKPTPHVIFSAQKTTGPHHKVPFRGLGGGLVFVCFFFFFFGCFYLGKKVKLL